MGNAAEIHELIDSAFAAVRHDPDRGWSLLIVEDDGALRIDHGLTRRELRPILQIAADRWRSYTWDDKRRRWKSPRDADLPIRGKRPPIPASVRFDVLARDGHRCVYCGRGADEVALHVDHRIPVSKGGPTEPDNLVTACQPCNLGKSDRLPPRLTGARP